jgi:hypothetical protein
VSWDSAVSAPKQWLTFTGLHGIISQKIEFSINFLLKFHTNVIFTFKINKFGTSSKDINIKVAVLNYKLI